MKRYIKQLLKRNENEARRNRWLKNVISNLPAGLRILDAGAGELRNKPLCSHLDYISQDFCQYEGNGDGKGLQTGTWDTGKIDLICDITAIPAPDESFDAILCSEVFEHLPDPLQALDEFNRLLKPGASLILTAPFSSWVHFAPYHFCTGFSRYWYEHHLKLRDFQILELTPNGDWFDLLHQELLRLPCMAQRYGDWCWPLSFIAGGLATFYLILTGKRVRKADDVACFGWHCVAVKRSKGATRL